MEPLADGLPRQHLDVTREGVVALVAVHVHQEMALGRDPTQALDRRGTVGHGPLEMRNATHHVNAHVERRREGAFGLGPAQVAVLGEGDELEIDLVAHQLAHLEQRLDRLQIRVADVDVAANDQRPAGDRPAAQLERPVPDRVVRQRRLQLRPELDALQQGAGAVHARHPVGQRRVHVEVGVDERRRDELALRVDRPLRLGPEVSLDGRDAAVPAGDRHPVAAVRQDRVGDDEIEHGVVGPRHFVP